MIDNLEALVALAECGTMSRAALRLSITQSAVSKRIANLQGQLGKPLVERSGRGVALTPYAQHVLQRTRPLLGELREALSEEVADNTGQLSVAIGAAILIAWGAEVLAKVRQENPGIRLRINTYRGPEAVERVRSGEYMVGICFGRSENTPDLEARYIVRRNYRPRAKRPAPLRVSCVGRIAGVDHGAAIRDLALHRAADPKRRTKMGRAHPRRKHHGVLSVGHPDGESRIRPRPRATRGGAGVRGTHGDAGALSRAGAEHPDQPVRTAVDAGAAAGADVSGIAQTPPAGAELNHRGRLQNTLRSRGLRGSFPVRPFNPSFRKPIGA